MLVMLPRLRLIARLADENLPISDRPGRGRHIFHAGGVYLGQVGGGWERDLVDVRTGRLDSFKPARGVGRAWIDSGR